MVEAERQCEHDLAHLAERRVGVQLLGDLGRRPEDVGGGEQARGDVVLTAPEKGVVGEPPRPPTSPCGDCRWAAAAVMSRCDVGVDLGPQRLGQHPAGSFANDLVDQRHPVGAAGVVGVGGSGNYGEHGSYPSDRRWRADLA